MCGGMEMLTSAKILGLLWHRKVASSSKKSSVPRGEDLNKQMRANPKIVDQRCSPPHEEEIASPPGQNTASTC